MVKKNILSVLLALVIMYLSLINPKKLEEIGTFELADKLVHTVMYFAFMSVILFENRKVLLSGKQLWLVSLIPLFYGILMEVLQGTITKTRTASFLDALFNGLGVIFAVLLWIWIKPCLKEKIR